jgi:hypothetical protein
MMSVVVWALVNSPIVFLRQPVCMIIRLPVINKLLKGKGNPSIREGSLISPF